MELRKGGAERDDTAKNDVIEECKVYRIIFDEVSKCVLVTFLLRNL